MYAPYVECLQNLHNSSKYRRLGLSGQELAKDYLDFSSNDYLNLSQNPAVIKAATLSAEKYGVGATGSRLLSGNLNLYEQFEHTIARDKHTEASLIFNTGFQANISALSCLLDAKVLKAEPLVFADKSIHASLYQGIFLTKAKLLRYQHNNMQHLNSILEKNKNNPAPKFIVTETVFGMDGDVAPLAQIVQLARQYNALLYLDEAHATGVLGPDGYGLSTSLQLDGIKHIIMGTFSKAIGTSGGYIACNKLLRDYFINKASGFIYSTAIAPHTVGAAFQSWQIIKSFRKERAHLQNLGTVLRNMLQANNFDIGHSQTHIVPIILKDEKACLQAQKALFEEKILVSCIRPPSVPPGTARLRIALSAKHTISNLETLVKIIMRVLQ